MKKKSSLSLKFLNPTSILVALGVLFILFQVVLNYRLSRELKGMIAQSQAVVEDAQQSQEYVQSFGQDLNEIREFLLLPAKEYQFNEPIETEEGSEEEVLTPNQSPTVALFSALEALGKTEQQRLLYTQNREHLSAYFNAPEILDYFKAHELSVQQGVDYHLVNAAGVSLITLGLDSTGAFKLETYQSPIKLQAPTDFESTKAKLKQLVENERADLEAQFEALNQNRQRVAKLLNENSKIQEMLNQKQLTLGSEEEMDAGYTYTISGKEGLPLTTITLSKSKEEIHFQEKAFSLKKSDDELASALSKEFSTLDGRDPVTQSIDALRQEIAALKNDQGFAALLKKYNLTFSFEPAETETEIRYAILDSTGKVVQILYIDKKTGQLMIKAPEASSGSPLSALQKPSLATSAGQLAPLKNQINILVAGKHGSNVDTMIFANMDLDQEKISLISIPRDLYHENRKINSVYADYGMPELTHRISEITGYKVDQYVLVDMYVFRDLIDLVGGVNVTLDQELIDPTYKTYENGLASTLYYAAGEHHLNGTEALRVARSRHSTSDYDRAARQQRILEALQAKAKNLGFGDAKTLMALIKTVLDRTETNISLKDALTYYFRAQNFELDRGYVLSSANVLESAKIPVDFNTSLQVEVCTPTAQGNSCTKKNAVYALLPRYNNWDMIRGYFKNVLEE